MIDYYDKWAYLKDRPISLSRYPDGAEGSIFSARPTSSATVSMPIRWDQLSSIRPTDFNMVNVPIAIKRTGDPWKNVLEEKQDTNKILEGVKQIE